MIRIEIEQNIRILEEFDKVLPAKGAQVTVAEAPEDRNLREWSEAWHRASAIADRPLPNWSQLAWTSQTSLLPRSVKSTEIERIAAFYAALDEITALRNSLVETRTADRQTITSFGSDWQPPQEYEWEFDKRVSQVGDNVMSLFNEAQHTGRECLSFLK